MSDTPAGETPATEPAKIVWEIDPTDPKWTKSIPKPVQEFINTVAARERKAAEERAAAAPTAAEREEARIERERRIAVERKLAETEGRWQDVITADQQAAKAREQEIAAQLEAARAEKDRIYQHAKGLLAEKIRAAAVAAGARDESLKELVTLLGPRTDLHPQTLATVVLAEDGTPSTDDVEGLVTAYLQAHPHHLGGRKGLPGRATGGASLRGHAINPAAAAKDALLDRAAAGDRKAADAYVASTLLGKR